MIKANIIYILSIIKNTQKNLINLFKKKANSKMFDHKRKKYNIFFF